MSLNIQQAILELTHSKFRHWAVTREREGEREREKRENLSLIASVLPSHLSDMTDNSLNK